MITVTAGLSSSSEEGSCKSSQKKKKTTCDFHQRAMIAACREQTSDTITVIGNGWMPGSNREIQEINYKFALSKVFHEITMENVIVQHALSTYTVVRGNNNRCIIAVSGL